MINQEEVATSWVSCTVCQAKIPLTAAQRTPAPDYALYFCARCGCEEWSARPDRSREEADVRPASRRATTDAPYP